MLPQHIIYKCTCIHIRISQYIVCIYRMIPLNIHVHFKCTKCIYAHSHSFSQQGPCVKNQETLARSRLLDAVSGFLHVFAILQRKLYRDTSQMELLRELLGLQEEMFILLLSMLEGRAMGQTICFWDVVLSIWGVWDDLFGVGLHLNWDAPIWV